MGISWIHLHFNSHYRVNSLSDPFIFILNFTLRHNSIHLLLGETFTLRLIPQCLHNSNHPNHFLLPNSRGHTHGYNLRSETICNTKASTTGTCARQSASAHLLPFSRAQCVNVVTSYYRSVCNYSIIIVVLIF